MLGKFLTSILGILVGANVLTFFPEESRAFVLLIVLAIILVCCIIKHYIADFLGVFIIGMLIGSVASLVWPSLDNCFKIITLVVFIVGSVVCVILLALNYQGNNEKKQNCQDNNEKKQDNKEKKQVKQNQNVPRNQ